MPQGEPVYILKSVITKSRGVYRSKNKIFIQVLPESLKKMCEGNGITGHLKQNIKLN